jgi:small subunit ribosomal protein S20
MANTKSAGKRARQTAVRTLRNRRVLSRLRTMHKKSSGEAAATDVRMLISAIDKAAKRGIVHKNAANRRKARLKKSLTKPAAAPAA